MKIYLAVLNLLGADGRTNVAKHFGESWSQIHHKEQIMWYLHYFFLSFGAIY
jgi:hypothetical protein